MALLRQKEIVRAREPDRPEQEPVPERDGRNHDRWPAGYPDARHAAHRRWIRLAAGSTIRTQHGVEANGPGRAGHSVGQRAGRSADRDQSPIAGHSSDGPAEYRTCATVRRRGRRCSTGDDCRTSCVPGGPRCDCRWRIRTHCTCGPLATSGARVAEVPTQVRDGALVFTADVACAKDQGADFVAMRSARSEQAYRTKLNE